jgi:hypothetical protein
LNSLSSESGFSDKSLNFRRFESKSSIRALFALESSSNGVFFDQSDWAREGLFILSFLDSIEFSDTSGSLGAKSSWFGLISKSRNFLFSLSNEN